MKKSKRSLFSAAVFAIVLLTGCASDLLDLGPGRPADLTPEELIAKMDMATDPQWVQRKMRSYIMKQTVTSVESGSKSSSSSELYFKLPDKMRMTILKDGKPERIVLSRDGRAWYINPANNRSTEVTGHDLKLNLAFNKMLKPGNNHLSIFKKVNVDKCLDDETGKDYYRLICYADSPDIAPYVFYVNPDTFLTDKFETVLYGGGGIEVLYIAHNEDYRWENGIRVPKRSYIKVAGKTDVSTVTEFKINPEIPDSVFDLPKPWNH